MRIDQFCGTCRRRFNLLFQRVSNIAIVERPETVAMASHGLATGNWMTDERKNKEQPASISRRKLIRAFALTTSTIGGSLVLDPLLGMFRRSQLDRVSPKELSELGRTFLFRDAKNISGIPGTGYPFFRDEIHPAARGSIDSVIERLGLIEEFKEIRPLDTSTIQGDSALFGGPVNNMHARMILGEGGPSPLFGLVPDSESAFPPVRFDISNLEMQIKHGEQKPWPLWIENRYIENPGELLLITSIPDPYQSDARLLNLASNLAPGMLATDFVLQNPRLLHRLIRQTQNLDGWQALIPVVKVVDGQPKELGEPEVFSINGRLLERLRKFLCGKPHFSNPNDGNFSAFSGLIASSLPRSAATRLSYESASAGIPPREQTTAARPSGDREPTRFESNQTQSPTVVGMDEIERLGEEIYNRLPHELQAKHRGEYILINVGTAQYEIARTLSRAHQQYKKVHFNAPAWSTRIGASIFADAN
jgi:hypothetical protein